MKLLFAILVGLPLSKPAPIPEPKPVAIKFDICPRGKKRTSTTTCVVDGDTIWLRGRYIRLKDFDTPETQTAFCTDNKKQQAYERGIGRQATLTLIHTLNNNHWTIEYFGKDRSGKRHLATIRINGIDIGEKMIRWGVARRWPDGWEYWCELPGPGRPHPQIRF